MPVSQRPQWESQRASQRQPQPPQPVRDGAVPDERVQPRIAGEHLPAGARRGVPVEYDGDVFTQTVEHAAILPSPTVPLNY